MIDASRRWESSGLEFLVVLGAGGVIVVELVQLRLLEALAAEDGRLEPVRRHLGPLVFHVRAGWDGEDVI